jgi:hypothetical protein
VQTLDDLKNLKYFQCLASSVSNTGFTDTGFTDTGFTIFGTLIPIPIAAKFWQSSKKLADPSTFNSGHPERKVVQKELFRVLYN